MTHGPATRLTKCTQSRNVLETLPSGYTMIMEVKKFTSLPTNLIERVLTP